MHADRPEPGVRPLRGGQAPARRGPRAPRLRPLEAERIALYVIRGVRPISQFLKVLTREKVPGDDEIIDALTRALDEAPALMRATLLLRADEDEG